MVPIVLSVNVSDAVDVAPACRISGVSSNEPVDADGDWMVTGALTLSLRSERLGNGSGRVYTVAVSCADHAQNTSTATTTITVGHDERK